MRGSKWVAALQEADELPRYLRESQTKDPVEVEGGRAGKAFGALLCLIGGTFFLGLDLELAAAILPAVVFLLVSLVLALLSKRENSADRFFRQLKAARDILGIGFEAMARLPQDRLRELAEEQLRDQASQLVGIQAQLKTDVPPLRRARLMGEETAAREELGRRHQVFLALGLAYPKYDAYFPKPLETQALDSTS